MNFTIHPLVAYDVAKALHEERQAQTHISRRKRRFKAYNDHDQPAAP